MHYPPIFPDPFAIEWGHDKFGTFQSFAVENVVQRMRWIPPGTFMMGSPENEVGRYEDEFQHKVELTNGFWLGDTPVTQALWEVVMGTNPSQFRGPNNPVEQVSWQDCQEFIARLNVRIETLNARLPAEAEWEYACRAGTKTATWVGDLQSGQEAEAPLLDTIAWYIGNAGGTPHPVAQKAANPWGLYDMLGNVWDWCDGELSHYAGDPRNLLVSSMPSMSAQQVFRGGSWGSNTNFLRAAYRFNLTRFNRYDDVGLRLARSATRGP
jgi:formylglycine-generating enzyme required for sulfatase activity